MADPGLSPSSCSDNKFYPEFCRMAANDDVVFSSFRSDKTYRSIVETCGRNLGLNYLHLIRRYNPALLEQIDKLLTNDSVGGPQQFEYQFPNGPALASPTTLRYIGVLGNLISFFGSLDNLNIVEIGAGYGGQCRLIKALFRPKSYTIIDLDPSLLLCRKYLSAFDIHDVVYANSNQAQSRNFRCDLVISNYAFTEIEGAAQQRYFNNVIEKAPMGYLLCNFVSHTWQQDQFSESQLIERIGNVNVHRTAPPLTQLDRECGVSLLWWIK